MARGNTPRHRAGADLLAGRGGPVLLLPQGGPVRDITVWSSDRKGPPGRLSRQGPPVLRWALYEAGKACARASAPDHAYYATVKDRKNSKRAALSEARKMVRQACHILTELRDDALTAA
jgi:transposase